MNKIKNLSKTISNKIRCTYHLLAYKYCANKTAKFRANEKYANMYDWRNKGKDHMNAYLTAEKK